MRVAGVCRGDWLRKTQRPGVSCARRGSPVLRSPAGGAVPPASRVVTSIRIVAPITLRQQLARRCGMTAWPGLTLPSYPTLDPATLHEAVRPPDVEETLLIVCSKSLRTVAAPTSVRVALLGASNTRCAATMHRAAGPWRCSACGPGRWLPILRSRRAPYAACPPAVASRPDSAQSSRVWGLVPVSKSGAGGPAASLSSRRASSLIPIRPRLAWRLRGNIPLALHHAR